MRELLWQCLAWVLSRPFIADLLIELANRPYLHIYGKNGGPLYMGRWWLFNPYPSEDEVRAGATRPAWREMLPSIRIHWILRPDNDRHLHDHPWDARTIILKTGYREERYVGSGRYARAEYWRQPGYTGPLSVGEYHRISHVPNGGAWTLFITWKRQGSWGFDVDGVKVPWHEYLGIAQ